MTSLLPHHNLEPVKSANSTCLQISEDVLVNGLREGDPKIFRKLYKMYASNLMGIIMHIVKSRETAEDLLQESFIKISKNIHRYDRTKSRLFTWMLNIARNTAIDYLRKLTTKNGMLTNEIEEVAPQIERCHFYCFNADTIGLKRMLDSLPEKQKMLVEMTYFLGYTHVETAEKTGIPIGSIKTSIRAAISFLRKSFMEKQYYPQSA